MTKKLFQAFCFLHSTPKQKTLIFSHQNRSLCFFWFRQLPTWMVIKFNRTQWKITFNYHQNEYGRERSFVITSETSTINRRPLISPCFCKMLKQPSVNDKWWSVIALGPSNEINVGQIAFDFGWFLVRCLVRWFSMIFQLTSSLTPFLQKLFLVSFAALAVIYFVLGQRFGADCVFARSNTVSK